MLFAKTASKAQYQAPGIISSIGPQLAALDDCSKSKQRQKYGLRALSLTSALIVLNVGEDSVKSLTSRKLAALHTDFSAASA